MFKSFFKLKIVFAKTPVSDLLCKLAFLATVLSFPKKFCVSHLKDINIYGHKTI